MVLRSKSTDSESESGRESKPAFSFFSIVFEFGRRFHLVRPAARAWPRFTDQRSTLERGAETMPSHVARVCTAARRVDARRDRQRVAETEILFRRRAAKRRIAAAVGPSEDAARQPKHSRYARPCECSKFEKCTTAPSPCLHVHKKVPGKIRVHSVLLG